MYKRLILLGLTAGLLAGPAMAETDLAAPDTLSDGDTPLTWGPQVEGERFEYTADGETYHGYLARSASDTTPRPAVLIVHEWWGLNDYVKHRADQLAALGFVALAVDMYGEGQTADHPDQAGEFSSQVMQNWPGARNRLEAAMAQLREHPAVADGGMAAIGYCFGGSVVMNMALAGMPLEAVISYHGSPTQAVDAPADFGGAVQIHNGAADPMVARDDLEAMADALTATGAEVEVINYHDATHGFTNPGADAAGEAFGLPLGYDPIADAVSWQSTLLLLDRALNN
ncbi:dienelactone hydrolase family protein [Halomonas sp. ML-15]|uniref:dienelactone hydrolase family protein n=1 Tax=Halomonas sp. ML-15 TaxID=2773305 RepID=UPI001CD109C4|nr:dienelactone hydrolase family protein [Halomonas sp. ML-15]